MKKANLEREVEKEYLEQNYLYQKQRRRANKKNKNRKKAIENEDGGKQKWRRRKND